MPEVHSSRWLQELRRDGFAIIRGAVSPERSNEYASAALSWAESFPLGFKKEDPSTWDADHLPIHYTGGLFTGYAVAHEDFVWRARQEEKISQAFAEIWGTSKLICSFDAINISLPQGPHGRKDIVPTVRWPHQDQNPRKTNFELVQGLLAVTESGKDDGGLIVLKGTHLLQERFFRESGGIKAEQDSGDENHYFYTEDDIKWFLAQDGVEEIKVETQAGDFVVWDSRTVHFNCAPTGHRTRVVIYICMAPASFASEDALKKKSDVFDKRLASTHWPHLNVIPYERYGPVLRGGVPDPHDRSRPLHEPVLTSKLLRLAGVEAYPE
ncbi:hypothetical protein P7C70_g6324, partial [Phenoliferia sp. Uapishka_3]